MRNTELRRKLVLFFCSLFFSIYVSGMLPVHAADPVDKLIEIKDNLKSKLQNLKEVKKEEESVISKIKDINSNISNKEKELGQYNKRITQTRSQLKSVSKEVSQISNRLETSQEFLEEHIVALYKRQYNNDAMMLMSADDYSDLIKKSRYISLAAYHNNKVLNEYKDELTKANSRGKKLEKLQATLKTNKDDIRKKKNEFQADLATKDKLLKEVRARRSSQEKKIKDLKASSRKIMSMVNKLKATEMPKSILGKGFIPLKGRLPWPVKGELIESFGKYKDPEFGLAGFRNGIEIKVRAGAVAQAIAGGRVVYANRFEGFGNMLIIDHGSGYHSLYGNLSEMSLEKGNLVINGMDVGKVSDITNLNVPALYFEIRYKGKPINPMDWLENHRSVRSASN
ncbi:MAG: peptidoglycan DD-metalloendopeptidase family protein [Nitrospira sp.]|nr:peptidoglycan DD-metalloendopeptidase family protein [Nitrospira sp.]